MTSTRSACFAVARTFATASVLFLFASCGSAGSGGTTGAGGSGGTGAGGTGETGGATGKGGATGTGGASSTGGATGSGGVTGTGGVSGTGGTIATGMGGARATGGATGSGGKAGSTGKGGATGTGGSGTGGVGTGGSGTGGAGTGGSGAGGRGTGGSGACPTTTLKAGDTTETITSGGESRSFIVHVPPGYTGSSAVPVILDFHPLGGTGSSQESSSGWKGQCDSAGCLAIFPNSSSKAGDNSWNAGYCCDNAEKNQIDDVQFARDMIKWLEANACVDPKRIYASGGSNGGGMTYRLACQAADVIAAVAPVDFRCVTGKDPLANAGQVTAANNTACVCTLPRSISVVAYDEGQDNSIVPYNGAQTPSLATDCAPNTSCVGIGFPGAVVNFQTWAGFDGCTGSASADPNNSICQQYTSCMGGTTVILCTNPSSSHLAAYSSATAKVAATAWNVFKTQSLP
jgi:polyhydroxybutyrate depolymerase